MRPIDEMTAERAAEACAGLHYTSNEFKAANAAVEWEGMWPEINRDGILTGRTVGDEAGFLNVADEAMILAAEAEAGGWVIDREEGRAEPPRPVVVELAEATETIRICGGLEDYAGLEHHAMEAAVQAYHSAAAEALARDPRASRLDVRGPRGQRILHSGWCGAKWGYQSGAIGVMSETLTEAEKAAISAADDAGRAAAKNEIEE